MKNLLNLTKKLPLSILLTLFAGSLFAQDIIVTRRAGNVEAKIVEITDTHVKYRKASNPTGTVYAVAKSEVYQIRYEDGRTVTITAVAAPSAQAASPAPAAQAATTRAAVATMSAPLATGKYATSGATSYKGTTAKRVGMTAEKREGLMMNGTRISHKEALDYAQSYPEAVRHLKAARRMYNGALVMAGVGGGLLGGGLGLFLGGGAGNSTLAGVGAGFIVGGTLIAGGGFILAGASNKRNRRAAAAYNSAAGIADNFSNRDVTLALAAAPGGLGLSLTF